MPYHETGPFDLAYKMGVLQQLPPVKYPRLMLALALNGEQEAGNGAVVYDLEGNQTLGPAQPVNRRGLPETIGLPGDKVRQFTTQDFAEMVHFDASDDLNRRPVGLPANASVQEVIASGQKRKMVKALQTLKDRVGIHMQHMAWGLALNNLYTFSGRQASIRVEGVRDSSLAVSLTGSDMWSAPTTADPVGDILDMVNRLSDKGGVTADTILMSPAAYANAFKNEKFRAALVDNLNTSVDYLYPKAGNVEPASPGSPYAVKIEARLQGQYDIIVAREQNSGSYLIGDHNVLVLNRASWSGPTFFGPINNQYAIDRGLANAPFFPYEEVGPHGAGKDLVLRTSRIWIPSNFNACGRITTHA